MQGCRPLTDDELKSVKTHFDMVIGDGVADQSNLQTRNKTLFFFGLYTGLRISESLSFTIGDLIQRGEAVENVYLRRANAKGKKQGRNCPLNEECRRILKHYFDYYKLSRHSPDTYFWFSKKSERLQKCQAWTLYKNIFEACGLDGKFATHTTRNRWVSYDGRGCYGKHETPIFTQDRTFLKRLIPRISEVNFGLDGAK